MAESCWTRTCTRGHTYEGRAHFDYCPQCYDEIPEWSKEVMRAKAQGESMTSGNILVTTEITGTPRTGKTTGPRMMDQSRCGLMGDRNLCMDGHGHYFRTDEAR